MEIIYIYIYIYYTIDICSLTFTTKSFKDRLYITIYLYISLYISILYLSIYIFTYLGKFAYIEIDKVLIYI